MHEAVIDYVVHHIPPAVLSVLEFGSRNLNGSVRSIIQAPTYVGVDLYEGPDVDIVGDAATVDLSPQRFDMVVCTELFEHADDDICAAIVANAWRHLEDGGTFIATMAGPGRGPHSALEATSLQPGEFYRNVDSDLLASWLEDVGFEAEIDVAGLDIRCVGVKPA